MAENVRVIVIGESADEFHRLKAEFAGTGLSVELCEDSSSLDDSFDHLSKGSIIACSATSVFNDGLAIATEVKQERPFLPVILYSQKVREVLRLRCIELGLDDCVSRENLVSAATFLSRLLSTTSTEATLEDVKATPAPESKKGQMYFQLNGDELSNALQFLCMTSRNGRLSLKFNTGQSGAIFIEKGTVRHAEYEHLEGVRSLSKMLRSGAMEARFYEGREAPKTTNTRPISNLLIEASVMADEDEG